MAARTVRAGYRLAVENLRVSLVTPAGHRFRFALGWPLAVLAAVLLHLTAPALLATLLSWAAFLLLIWFLLRGLRRAGARRFRRLLR